MNTARELIKKAFYEPMHSRFTVKNAEILQCSDETSPPYTDLQDTLENLLNKAVELSSGIKEVEVGLKRIQLEISNEDL